MVPPGPHSARLTTIAVLGCLLAAGCCGTRLCSVRFAEPLESLEQELPLDGPTPPGFRQLGGPHRAAHAERRQHRLMATPRPRFLPVPTRPVFGDTIDPISLQQPPMEAPPATPPEEAFPNPFRPRRGTEEVPRPRPGANPLPGPGQPANPSAHPTGSAEGTGTDGRADRGDPANDVIEQRSTAAARTPSTAAEPSRSISRRFARRSPHRLRLLDAGDRFSARADQPRLAGSR